MAMRRVWLVIERRMRGGKEKSPRERERNECRRRRMTTIQRFMTVGEKAESKTTGNKKKSRKRRRRRKGISLVLHTRVSGPDPSLRSACVYLIFPYTFCLELWQVANDARQEEEYKKWKGIFFLVLYFYLSHLFLPGYSSFAPVLAGWIGAPAPKGSKARAPTTYNIYRRPCVHFFLVPTWNLRERAGPFYPPPKFWKCI